MTISWYFHRTTLAQKIADDYTSLDRERVAMFANRQKGKTQFCLRDLIPEMRKRGYLPIYVDFWSNKDDPALAFANGIMESYDKLGLTEKPLTLKALKISTPHEFGLSAELGLGIDSPDFSMSAADEAIAYLLKLADHKPLFIVLDEVQHLATKNAYEAFVAKLRSFLINKAQLCKHPIKALFIGSDQARLADLFKSSKAPFYRATDVTDFPDLGRDFVEFTVNNYEQRMDNVRLDREQAHQLFCNGGKMPGAFTDLLKEMASTENNDLQAAAQEYNYFSNAVEMYREVLKKLNKQDIAILGMLSMGANNIYTPNSLRMMASLAGKSGSVTTSSAQGSMRKLEGRGLIITKGHGVWDIADTSMKEWIKECSRSEIKPFLDAPEN